MLILYVKALHVIFMVTWFAALFYLPRLFVYHAMTTDTATSERFKVMEQKLGVMMDIGADADHDRSASGCSGSPTAGARTSTTGWLHVKLTMVALLRRLSRLVSHAGARLPARPQHALAPLVPRVQRAADGDACSSIVIMVTVRPF